MDRYSAGILILLAALIAGCTQFPPCISGSGVVVSETRTLEPFQKVDLATFGTVYLTQGEPSPAVIEAENNILPLLRTRVSDGVLTIDLEQCVRNTRPVIIRLTTDKIRQISVSGSGSVIGEDEIISESLETGVSGSGVIDLPVRTHQVRSAIAGSGRTRLRGTTADHTAAISGSGKIEAFGLETENSTVVIEGSGAAEVFATEALDVTVSGSGTVTYRGNPAHLSQEISGSGRVAPAD